MTTKQLQLLDEAHAGSLSFDAFNRMESMLRQQVEDAEANLAFTEKQYVRAKKELGDARKAYAQICANDPNELRKRRNGS